MEKSKMEERLNHYKRQTNGKIIFFKIINNGGIDEIMSHANDEIQN